jgi:hypothetical protein
LRPSAFAATGRGFAAALALVASVACQTPPPPPEFSAIPRTGVSLYVPVEFRVAEDFPGLTTSDGFSSVMVSEIARRVESVRRDLTPQSLSERGLRTLRSEELMVDERAALLVHAIDQGAARETVRHWMLVFGEGDLSILITASTTKALSPTVGPLIETILREARWDPMVTAGRFADLGFTITESPGLKVSERLPQMVVLTRDGSREGLSVDEPLLFAGSSLAAGLSIDLAEFARTQLREMAELRDLRIVSEGPVALDDLEGHEIVAKAVDRKEGTPLSIYQAIATDGRRYYLVQGLVGALAAEEFMPQFRDIAASFERTREPLLSAPR